MALPAKIRMTRLLSRSIGPACVALLLAAPLGGCASGDFGRVRADMRNDDMHRWIGGEANRSLNKPASEFSLTEYERQLRDLAYPMIEPPLSRPAWKNVFGEYKPIAPPWQQGVQFDPTLYGRRLIDEPHRSHSSRYSVLIDDVRNDLTRFGPFYASAGQVIDLDRKRAEAMRMVALSPQERIDGIARMDENALIVQWVEQCLEQRVASYRWALSRLVVHYPDGLAAQADILITELAAQTFAKAGSTPRGRGRVLRVGG